jgi:hypothetical protein
MNKPDPIFPGPGVTKTTRLSDYFPGLRGTPGDTPVYLLEGRKPGGTALILGGTHGDEPSGYLTAVLLVENAVPAAGRLIVIPRANASGFTHNVPQEGHPQAFFIETDNGPRRFTYGARATNPVHQWPDPQVYVQAGSGQSLSGSETRNLNRAYPGRPNGTLTERIAFGIMSLIRKEKVDMAFDLHEASPEYPVVNTMVAHERAMEVAALVNMNLQVAGVEVGLEASPANLPGLSHREWGDHSQALAVLSETTNPAQGRLRGKTEGSLVVQGRDRFYELAARRGQLSVPFTSDGWPVATRVARHLAMLTEFFAAGAEFSPDRAVTVEGLPSYDELVSKGLGPYLSGR